MTNQALITVEEARFLPALSLDQAISRRDAMVQFVKELMVEGTDYGKIPSTDKAVLLKPGAERLCSFFGLTPDFEVVKEVEDWSGDEPLFYYRYKCRLLRDGRVVGDGEGSCNSRESKYRWRTADRACPKCGAAAIKRSKYPPKNDKNADPGWYCFAKAGGCGAEFSADDPAITSQATGRMPNPDIFDLINTFQKMAQKRAFIAATLIAVNASEYFTQDLDEIQPIGAPAQDGELATALRADLGLARDRLRQIGGTPTKLTQRQVESMSARELADELARTNGELWSLATVRIEQATQRETPADDWQGEFDQIEGKV